jgi:GNAT superfamily N-acetyltransferase
MFPQYREIDAHNEREVYDFVLCHEYAFRDSSSLYVPDSEEQRREKATIMAERLLSGDEVYHCLAAFDGAKMVGAHFLHRMSIDKLPACHVHGLWVHAEHRKTGIARRLKELGEAWARSKGCILMDSNVRVTNLGMIALNESMGYEVARFNFRKRLS